MKVSGSDTEGNPFKQTAYAWDVSHRGIRIDGIMCLKKPGQLVDVQYKGQTAKFIVVWMGTPGTSEQGHIGLKSLAPERNIFGVTAPAICPDTYATGENLHEMHASAAEAISNSPDTSVAPQPTQNRRQYTRHRCVGTVEFRLPGSKTSMLGTGISKTLGLKSTAGLSTVLSGIDKVEDAIVPFPQLPNLQVLPAGPIPPNPVELLRSSVMKDYIARWRNEYDHIIIDTPPRLSVTDSVVLSVEADRVILVARSGQTPKAALRRAMELLMQVNARVMGVVLNAFNLRSADGYYYYYGSKYASRYYQQSEEEAKQGARRPNQDQDSPCCVSN